MFVFRGKAAHVGRALAARSMLAVVDANLIWIISLPFSALGGNHIKSNIQITHPRCNQKKHAKDDRVVSVGVIERRPVEVDRV